MRPSLQRLASLPPTTGSTYSSALVRGLSANFAAAALRSSGATVIDQARAAQQHDAYVKALSQLVNSKVTHVDASTDADCVFIEDTAVCLGNTALITRPGAPSRQAEVEPVAQALAQRGMRVVRAAAPATLDGGDVLWTGRELLVGLTARTNKAGAEAVARAFPGVRVTTVPLAQLTAGSSSSSKGGRSKKGSSTTAAAPSPLHLKSILTLAGPDTLAVADTPVGQAVAWHVQDKLALPKALRQAGGSLSFLLLPDAEAANVVYANGRLLIRESSSFPASAEVLHQYAAAAGLEGGRPIEVDTSELAKADGALTCCSILLQA